MKWVIFFMTWFFMLSSDALALELRDVKPPETYPGVFSGWVIGLIAVLAVAIFIGIWFYLKSRRAAGPLKPDPWGQAHAALVKISEDKLITDAKINEFYTRLSAILRHFIESSFQISAPEMTTDEFLTHIRRNSIFTIQQQQTLAQFLQSADYAKFARQDMTEKDMVEHFKVAENFIESSRPSTIADVPVEEKS